MIIRQAVSRWARVAVMLARSKMARRQFQPVFRSMYRLALAGMNIGTGSEVDSSGETYALSRLTRLVAVRPLVVIDGGANTGLFTRAVLEKLASAVTIYAFEPARSTFRQLERNLGQQPNVRLYNLGLGERETTGSDLHDHAVAGPELIRK